MAIATSTIVALGLAAAAAGASYYNTVRTQDRQDKQAALGIRNQSKKQAEADARVAQLVDETGKSSPQAAITQQTDDYLAQLQRNQSDANVKPGVGGFSETYAADAAKANAGLGDFGGKMAGLLARIDAPGLQRRQEGVLFNNAATDLGKIKRNAAGDAFIDNLKLQSITRDPYLDAFASFAGGASSGVAGGWGSAGTGDAGSLADLYADDAFTYF